MASILAFFRFIGWRNLLLLLLGIAVVILVRRQFFPDNPAKPRVTSLFEKVEYVRELRLITFYGEEIMQIGVQDAMERKVEDQEAKVKNERLQLTQAEQQLELANDYLNKASKHKLGLEGKIRSLEQEREDLRNTFQNTDPGSIITISEVRDILADHPNAFGREVSDKVRMWENLPSSRPEKQAFAKEIRQAVSQQRETRKSDYEEADRLLENQLDQAKAAFREAKKQLNEAERFAKRANVSNLDAFQAFQQDSILLEELRIQAQDTTNSLPKLMAIVSTEVTAYVDLEGMESNLDGDELTLCGVQPARIDSNVRMRLAEENRYLTAAKLTSLATGVPEDQIQFGVYYQVFQEIKEAMAELENQVIADAVERGILTEANDLALSYLEQMGRSLGFSEVSVTASCEPDSPDQSGASPPDSTSQILEEIRLKSDTLDLQLEDSSLVFPDTLQVEEP